MQGSFNRKRSENSQNNKYEQTIDQSVSTKSYQHKKVQYTYGSLTGQVYLLSTILDQNNKLFSTMMEKNFTLDGSINHLAQLVHVDVKKNQNNLNLVQNNIKNSKNKHAQKLQFALFGKKQYRYSIQLSQILPQEFYKQHNFNIKLKLTDYNNNIVRNTNTIPISLIAYNSNDEPQLIIQNKKRKPIFKGNCQSSLSFGIGQFEKLQFRQVTSIYQRRWIYFVIFAKSPSFNYTNRGNQKQLIIDYSDIRPLILSQIVVRSKKK